MNQAIAQKLVMGRDVIFTFGPYSSIYTRRYHPATDGIMLAGSVYLALSLWMCLYTYLRAIPPRWLLLWCLTMGANMYAPDALLFLYPLLAGLMLTQEEAADKGRSGNDQAKLLFTALAFSPLGLLPLIKGSALVLCAAITLCSIAFLSYHRRWLQASVCLGSPFVSLAVWWHLAGQPLNALPAYLASMLPIISGYTASMSQSGRSGETVAYLLASLYLLWVLYRQAPRAMAARLFLFSLYFLFLFFAFKAGFVRHDGHAMIASSALLLATLLLPALCRHKTVIPLLLALLVWTLIDAAYLQSSPLSLTRTLVAVYRDAWHGLQKRVAGHSLQSEYAATLSALKRQAQLPLLPGGTDIYSFNQASWSPLLTHYRLDRVDNDSVVLRRRAVPTAVPEPRPVLRVQSRQGATVAIPVGGQQTFASIDIRPSLLGQVMNILYKPRQLLVTVHLKNGRNTQYRLIAGMASSRFLISPLIESTTESGLLYRSQPALEDKDVHSISITSEDGILAHWEERYTITFSRMPWPARASSEALRRFYGMAPVASTSPLTVGVAVQTAHGLSVCSLADLLRYSSRDIHEYH